MQLSWRRTILLGITLAVTPSDGKFVQNDLRPESVEHLLRVLEASTLLYQVEQNALSKLKGEPTPGTIEAPSPSPSGEEEGPEVPLTTLIPSSEEELESFTSVSSSAEQVLRRLRSILPPMALTDLQGDILAALGRLRETSKVEQARDEPECFLLTVIDAAFAREAGEEDCASASIKWLAARSKKKSYQTFAAIPEARAEIFEAFRQHLRHRGPRDLKEPAVVRGIFDAAFLKCITSEALRRRLVGGILGVEGEIELEGSPRRPAGTLQEFSQSVKGAYATVKSRYPGLSAPVRDVLAMRQPSSTESADELVRAYQTERTAAINALYEAFDPHIVEEGKTRLEAIFSLLPLSDLQMYRSNGRALMCKIIYSLYPTLTNGHDLFDCQMSVIRNLQRRATTPSDRAILDDGLLGADLIFDAFVDWVKQSHLEPQALELPSIEEAIYGALKDNQDILEHIANAIWSEAAARDQYPKSRAVPRDAPTYVAFCAQVRDQLQEISAFDPADIPPAAQVDVSGLSVEERLAAFERLAHQGPLIFTLERIGHPLASQLQDKTASEQSDIIYNFYAPKFPEDSPESAALASKRTQLAAPFGDWVLNQSTEEPNFELAVIASDLNLCTAQEARPLIESLPPPLQDNIQAAVAIRKLSKEQIRQLTDATPEVRECFATVLGGHPATFPLLDEFASVECKQRLLEAIRHHPMDIASVFGATLQQCLADPRLEASLYTGTLRWSAAHATGGGASRLDPSKLEFLRSADDRAVAFGHLQEQFWKQQKKVLLSPTDLTAEASATSLQELFSAVQPLFVPIVTAVEELYPRSQTRPVDLTLDQLLALYRELIRPDGAFSVALRTLKGETKAQQFVAASAEERLRMLLEDELKPQTSLHTLYQAHQEKVLAFHQRWVVGDVPGPCDNFAADLYTHLTGEALIDEYSRVFITQVANPATVAASYGTFVSASDRADRKTFSDHVFAQMSNPTEMGRQVLGKINGDLTAAPGLEPGGIGLEFTHAHTVSSYCQELASRYAEAKSRNDKVNRIMNAAMDNNLVGVGTEIASYRKFDEIKVRGALRRLSLDQLSALEATPRAARFFVLAQVQNSAFAMPDITDPNLYEGQIQQSLAAFLGTDPLADHLAKQAGLDQDQLMTALLAAARIRGSQKLRPLHILSAAYDMVKGEPKVRQQFVTAISEYLLGREGLYSHHPDSEEVGDVSEDLSLARVVAKVRDQSASIHTLIRERLPPDIDESALAGKDNRELVRMYLELLDAEQQRHVQLEAARTATLDKIPSTRYPAAGREQIKALIQGLDLEELQRLIDDGEAFECLLLQHAMPGLASDPAGDCQASLQAGLLTSINLFPPTLVSFAAALVHPHDGVISAASLYMALRDECTEHGYGEKPDIEVIFNRAYRVVKQNPPNLATIQTALIKVLAESRGAVVDAHSTVICLENTLLQDVQQVERRAKTADDLIPEIIAAMPNWLAAPAEAHIKSLPLEQLLALKTQVQSGHRGIIDLATRVRLGALWNEISPLSPERQTEAIRTHIIAQMTEAGDYVRNIVVEAPPEKIRRLFEQWMLNEQTREESLEAYVYIGLRIADPRLEALAHFYGLKCFLYKQAIASWLRQLLKGSPEMVREVEEAPAEVKYCAAIRATNPSLFGPPGTPPYKFSSTNCLQVLYARIEALLTSTHLSVDLRHIRHYAAGIWRHLDDGVRSQFLPLLLPPLANAANLLEKWLGLLTTFYPTHRAVVHTAFGKAIADEGLLNAGDFDAISGTGTLIEDLESILGGLTETPKGWLVSIAPSHMREMAYALTAKEAAVVQGVLSGVTEHFEYRLAIELLARKVPIFEGFCDKPLSEQCHIVNYYTLRVPKWICEKRLLPELLVKYFRLYIESQPADKQAPIPQYLFERILEERRYAATTLLLAKMHPRLVTKHKSHLEASISKISPAYMLRMFTDNLELQAFVVGALSMSMYGEAEPSFDSPQDSGSRRIAQKIITAGGRRIPADFQRSPSKLISAVYEWMGKNPGPAKTFERHLRDGKVPFENVGAKS